MNNILDSTANALQQASSEPLGLLLAVVLGVVSAAISACCAVPILGILIGYSGSQESVSKKNAFMKALFFTIGAIIALMIIGGIAGFVGQVASASLGRYWKIFAGVLIIFFGLTTLNFLPFKLSFGRFENVKKRLGASSVMLTGLVLGGLIAVTSLCCNPAIFVVIGVAVLQKQIFQASLLLGMYAIGFSIPLGAVLLGISLSKALFLPKSADVIIRWVAGGVQLIVGFYFLITF